MSRVAYGDTSEPTMLISQFTVNMNNQQFQTPSPSVAAEANMVTKYELLLHHQSAMMSAQRMAHRYEAEQKKEWSKFFKSKAKLEALSKEFNVRLPAVENEVTRTLTFNN